MKKFLAIIFLFPVMVFGQQTTQNNDNSFPIIKHEFGLNMYSMTDMQIYRNMIKFNLHPDPLVTNLFFTGVYYKYYFGKNGLRSSFDYFHNVKNIDWHWGPYVGQYTRETKSGEIKLGYERLFAVKRYIPYAFSDMLYSYGQTTTNGTDYDECSGIYTYRNNKSANYELGISLGIGFKYRPIKNLSIGIETSFQSVCSSKWRLKEIENNFIDYYFFWNPIRILSIGLTL